jgi:hypothetical protein
VVIPVIAITIIVAVVMPILAVVVLPIALVVHLAIMAGSHPNSTPVRRTSPVTVMPLVTVPGSIPIPADPYVAISRTPRCCSDNPGWGWCSNSNSDGKVGSEEGSYGQ